MEDSVDPVEVLQAILDNILSNSQSKEEIIKMWLYIGRMMGMDHIFPEIQVILTPDENGKNQPIALVGSLDTLIIDCLTHGDVLNEALANICLDKIKDMEVIH